MAVTLSNQAEDFKKSANDTGSAPVQVSLLSERISELSAHLKLHPKDEHSKRGLLNMISRRKRLLKYIKNKSLDTYQKLIKKLGLRG